ncbi:hypothetical protein Tco_0373296 [Tanacetum coccineum]
MSSSKDVYFRKRIIAVTRLTIMKKYDYGNLEEIEVRREDQQLYTFKEGGRSSIRNKDGVPAKEEMKSLRQAMGSGYDLDTTDNRSVLQTGGLMMKF